VLARISPLAVGLGAAAVALGVAAIWYARPRAEQPESARAATVAVRITRHDVLGMPAASANVRAPPRVGAIVAALDVDALAPAPCPADYASAEVGIVLSGRDVYARRDVYVWDLSADAGAVPRVVVVSSAGCRAGPPADTAALRRELASALTPIR
jgi:hypothetical protein